MLKSGKALKVYSVRQKHLKVLKEQAKRYGILYCILRNKNIKDEVAKFRSGYTKMHYCFDDKEFLDTLEAFAGKIGF